MTSYDPFVSGKYLINGQWRLAESTAPVINPAKVTEVVGQVALCTREQVCEALDAAEMAFSTWSRSDIQDRVARMNAAAKELLEIIESHIPLFVRENGKAYREAKIDLARCVDVMVKSAEQISSWWEPEVLPGEQKVQVRKRARGITAIITPWNSPMILTFKRVVPAILTGNTVVVKPASNCPLTVMSFLKVLAAHFPPGVLNIVTGSGKTVGDVLTSDPRVRTVAFVGSTETGKEIMRKSATNLQKIYMELGGNDPAVILEDAELDEVAIRRLKNGILRAAGQVCSAIKRIYVHTSRYDELVSKLTSAFEEVIVGDGLVSEVNMGPINNLNQFNYLQGLLERTRQAGGKIMTLGTKCNPETWEQGYFMLPSLVTEIDQGSEIVQAEQFGPIIPILAFDDLDEVIVLANDSEFGLRASVWTENENLALELADRLEAGAVFFNNHTVFTDLSLDFPGIKESGLSRETRNYSFDLFTDSYGFAN